MTRPVLPDATLSRLEEAIAKCDPVPWVPMVEGRDQESGDSFIRTGNGVDRGEDIYVTRDSGPAPAEYLDLIATAVSSLPDLIREIRELRSGRL